jgi:hypothetical protein
METLPQFRTPAWRLAIFISATGAAIVAAAPATAVTPQDDYASHVVNCQRAHGFDGVMNPGMHEGRSGWDPGHSC